MKFKLLIIKSFLSWKTAISQPLIKNIKKRNCIT